MKKNSLFVLLILVLILSCKDTKELKPSNPTQNRLESYLKTCSENGLTGSILVAEKGKVLFSDGIGYMDPEKQIPISKSTIFTTGSITKQFTATAILYLAELGKLSTTDSISKFIKNVPEDKSGITIHQLLTHSSGIIGNLGYGVDFELIEKDDFLTQVFNAPLDFEPGTQYNYSNVGYSVLGIIIENVTQTDYESFLQQKLFFKVGMKTTGYLAPKWDENEIIHGYKCGEDWGTHLDKWKATSNQISYHLKGNGGILSTPLDLYNWFIALQENKIINQQSYELLTHAHAQERPDSDTYYGYSWLILNSDRKTKIIAHNGSNSVFYADVIVLPEEDVTIIYMTNQMRYDTPIVAWEIEKLLFDDTYEPSVPKMNKTKHYGEKDGNERLKIVNEFTDMILNKSSDNTLIEIETFANNHIPTINNRNRFKMWVQNLKREFSDFKLKHILEYEDNSYDIILVSTNGSITDLTPCFDLQIDDKNQIVAYGW
ncbi:serine hydrolase domain-containing protein [uncultured Maribacter sp.]|uniref:serine hydrolase domain-containing protein n=1 Tax=uncultured Maribacter sp. TaxID=431308 RepID=UPI0030EBA97B